MKKTTVKNVAATTAVKTGATLFGIFIGFCSIVFGLFLFAIPLIGWFLGAIFIFIGIVAPLSGLVAKTDDFKRVKGNCPRCQSVLDVRMKERATTCKICRRRVLIVKDGFELA